MFNHLYKCMLARLTHIVRCVLNQHYPKTHSMVYVTYFSLYQRTATVLTWISTDNPNKHASKLILSLPLIQVNWFSMLTILIFLNCFQRHVSPRYLLTLYFKIVLLYILDKIANSLTSRWQARSNGFSQSSLSIDAFCSDITPQRSIVATLNYNLKRLQTPVACS